MIEALLLVAAVTAEPSTNLPEFEFKDFATGKNYAMNSPYFVESCKPSEGGILCSQSTSVAGTWAAVTYRFYARRFVEMMLVGERNSYPAVLEAFRQRYGAPCRDEMGTVETAIRSGIPSRTTVWCFRTGNLTLSERGWSVTKYRATYSDSVFNGRSAPAATVDF